MKGDFGTSYQPNQKYLRRLVAKRKLNENEDSKDYGNSVSSIEKKKKYDYLWALVVNDIYETVEEKRKKLENLEEKLQYLRNDEEELDVLVTEGLIVVIEETNMFSMKEEEIATLRNHLTSWKQTEKASVDEVEKIKNDASNLKNEIELLDDQLKILFSPSEVKEDKEKNKDDMERKMKEVMKEQKEDIATKLELTMQENTLDQSLENLSQEKIELLKQIDHALNREMTEDLIGCCTETLLKEKQNMFRESQFKLKENSLEKTRIQRKKSDIRKTKGDIIKRIMELEVKIVNYKTKLQEFSTVIKFETFTNLMEKLK